MCGIVGMAGAFDDKFNVIFRNMLLFDTVRGLDSTGVFGVPCDPNQDYILDRCVGLPDGLLYKKDSILSDRLVVKGKHKLLLGHNRAATIGTITEDTAHPFEFGDIVGVHNGTLTYYSTLKGYYTNETDSQCLIQSISEMGIEWTWKQFYGAAALVWYNKKEKTLNFAKNNERPLHYAFSPDKKVIYWASEAWMIRQAAAYTKLEVSRDEKGVCNIFSFENDVHYKLNLSKVGDELNLVKGETLEETYARGYYAGYVVRKPTDKPRKSGPILYQHTNSTWAKDLERADKSSRGLEFTLTGIAQGQDNGFPYEYILGKCGNIIIQVVTNSIDNYKDLAKYTCTDAVFKTTARCRIVKDNVLRIASNNIRLIKPQSREDKVINLPFADPSDPPASDRCYSMVSSITGQEIWLDRETWIRQMDKLCGGCCCACGNPLTPEVHEELFWFDSKSPVCNGCGQDSWVRGHYGA